MSVALRIAFFTDAYWPRVNGVTVSVDLYARALVRAGHSVLIVCPYYPELPEIKHDTRSRGPDEPEMLVVSSLPVFFSKEDRLANYAKFIWVFDRLDGFKPDVLHVNSEFVIADFAIYYSRLRKLPVVYTFHTLWEEYAEHYFPFAPKFLMRFIARTIIKRFSALADTIIVPTKEIENTLQRYKIKKDTRLLPTGIDPSLFKRGPGEVAAFRADMEKEFPVLANKKILLFAGRITKEKNVGFILDIFPEIHKKHPDTVLVIAGNGPEFTALQKKSEKLGINENCVWTGYLKRDDLALAYAAADIFVFPSLTETQGLVTIEAMMSGTPVVAIGSMGTKIVMNGDNGGFMVDNDPSAFIEKVLLLLEDEDVYRQKSKEAGIQSEKWIIDNMTGTLVSIYETTITRRRSGGVPDSFRS